MTGMTTTTAAAAQAAPASTFKQSYGILQKHAETLRTQKEPNIDDLLQVVTESADAYKVCQERIDAVEKALNVVLESTAAASAAG